MDFLTSEKAIEVLVVERDAMESLLLKRFLRPMVQIHNIHRAKDGLEAIDYLENKAPFETVPRPDLIILNTDLPNLSGYDVLKKINNKQHLDNVPRIVFDKNAFVQILSKGSPSPAITPFIFAVQKYFKSKK